ncbi:MAG TPA: invasion associated locus B family protein [Pararhizobium sp.]|jgi:invasion protein IalB|nr:invasion associated locus B family protein [Pararhizobium sp.]
MALEKYVFALAILVATTAAATAGPTPTRIKQFNAWGAYSYQSSKGKVCYILSVPTSEKPTNVNHGDVFFLVSQRPGQNVTYEPQAMMGYELKEGSKVQVSVDGKDFTMFTKGNSAWAENAAKEPELVSDMRAGSKMTVKAVSSRGTDTEYTYSLSGVTAALDKIKGCK